MPKGVGYPSPRKAKKILRHKKVKGKNLTGKQKKLMGLIASGKMPTKLSEMPKSARKGVKIKSRKD